LIGDAFIGSGIAGMGAVFQPYLMDSYPAVVNDELIVSLSTVEKVSYTVANNFQAFNGLKQVIVTAVTFGIAPWLERDGDITVFCVLAAMVFVVDSGWLILFFYGKKLRKRDSNMKLFFF
jgi:hypothetical protein